MSEVLYINNIKIELPIRSVSLTRQINNIGDVKDRRTNYSNAIKVPKTTTNIATFEMLGIAGNTTKLPYEDVSAKYLIDGIEIITDGKCVVKNTSKYYELVIYDGNISLTDLLGNSELQTLDFSSYNHTLTSTLFKNSFTKIADYIYGIGKYSAITDVTLFNIDTINLSFYIHTLFSMIFTEKGYTISGDIFTETDYKSRVISMFKGYEQAATDNKATVYNVNHSAEPQVSDTFINPTIKAYLIDDYTATSNTTLNITILGSLILTWGTDHFMDIHINGVSVNITEVTTTIDYEKIITVNSGDVVRVYLTIFSEDDGGTEKIVYEINYTTTIKSNNLSITINIADLIGEMKQIDFVKEVMQHFGLLFRKVNNTNEFEFIKIKDLLSDKAGAEDWSDKYIGDVRESYKSNYAQENYMKYTYDSSDAIINPTFGNGTIVISDLNLAKSKTLLTSAFKASETYKGFSVLYHWILDSDNISIPNDDGLRIFKINNVTDTIKYKYNSTVISGVSYTGSIPLLEFTSYDTHINNYYLEQVSLLNTYKKIEVSVDLSIVDLYELDFFKLKYFRKLGQYFFLNKVKSFKKDRITRCEFVQLGDDVIDIGAIQGAYTGGTSYTGTLTSLAYGEMEGAYTSGSSYTGTLRLASLTSFSMSNTGKSEASVCAETDDTTHYHNGGLITPSINDTVYTDAAGTTVKIGGDLYFKITLLTYIQINNSGVVLSKSICE